MPQEVIQADYEQLRDVILKFQMEVDQVEQLAQRMENALLRLESGGWVGRGADAFYNEMYSLLMPGTKRLVAGLLDAGMATARIVECFQKAEEDAARLFEGSSPSGLMYDLRGDSMTSQIRTTMSSIFTSNPRQYLRDRVNRAVGVILTSPSGADLNNQLLLQNMRVQFPDGQTFGSTAHDAKVVNVVFSDLHWAGGQYVGATRTLTISTSRPFMPANTQELARVIVHETQHALDYDRNLYGGESFWIGDMNRLRQDAISFLTRQVDTEIRAHAREYALRDNLPYTEHNLFTPQAYDHIWNDRGYRKLFERELQKELGSNFTVRASYDRATGWHVDIRPNH